MKVPRRPISREAREYLKSKLDRMGRLERKKTEKRLEMFDRGFCDDGKDWKAEQE